MKISAVVYQYIIENQSLDIEGFGQFDIEKTDAYLHPIDHEISPADLKLKFRLDKNVVDSGFKAFLEKKFNINPAEVDKLLKTEREEWIKSLRANQDLVFDFVGILKVNSGGAVVFIQSQDFSLNKSSFGLSSFSMTPLKSAPKETVKTTAPVIPIKKSKSRIGLWISAASIIILLGAGYWFFGDMIFNPESNDVVENVEPPVENQVKNIEQPVVIVDSTETENIDSLVEDSVMGEENIETSEPEIIPEKTEAPIEEPVIEQPKQSEIASSSGGKYLVVVGCFREEQKADDYLNLLISKGYSASIEGKTSGGLIRVCYGRYSTWREAVKVSKDINNKDQLSSWVQKAEL